QELKKRINKRKQYENKKEQEAKQQQAQERRTEQEYKEYQKEMVKKYPSMSKEKKEQLLAEYNQNQKLYQEHLARQNRQAQQQKSRQEQQRRQNYQNKQQQQKAMQTYDRLEQAKKSKRPEKEIAKIERQYQKELRTHSKSPFKKTQRLEFGQKEIAKAAKKIGVSEEGLNTYITKLRKRESSDNQFARRSGSQYWGYWQMGKGARTDGGYRGSNANAYMQSKSTQLRTFLNYTVRQAKSLKNRNISTKNEAHFLGVLAAGHLKGIGGAVKMLKGQDNADALGTKTSEYYKMIHSAVNSEKSNNPGVIAYNKGVQAYVPTSKDSVNDGKYLESRVFSKTSQAQRFIKAKYPELKYKIDSEYYEKTGKLGGYDPKTGITTFDDKITKYVIHHEAITAKRHKEGQDYSEEAVAKELYQRAEELRLNPYEIRDSQDYVKTKRYLQKGRDAEIQELAKLTGTAAQKGWIGDTRRVLKEWNAKYALAGEWAAEQLGFKDGFHTPEEEKYFGYVLQNIEDKRDKRSKSGLSLERLAQREALEKKGEAAEQEYTQAKGVVQTMSAIGSVVKSTANTIVDSAKHYEEWTREGIISGVLAPENLVGGGIVARVGMTSIKKAALTSTVVDIAAASAIEGGAAEKRGRSGVVASIGVATGSALIGGTTGGAVAGYNKVSGRGNRITIDNTINKIDDKDNPLSPAEKQLVSELTQDAVNTSDNSISMDSVRRATQNSIKPDINQDEEESSSNLDTLESDTSTSFIPQTLDNTDNVVPIKQSITTQQQQARQQEQAAITSEYNFMEVSNPAYNPLPTKEEFGFESIPLKDSELTILDPNKNTDTTNPLRISNPINDPLPNNGNQTKDFMRIENPAKNLVDSDAQVKTENKPTQEPTQTQQQQAKPPRNLDEAQKRQLEQAKDASNKVTFNLKKTDAIKEIESSTHWHGNKHRGKTKTELRDRARTAKISGIGKNTGSLTAGVDSYNERIAYAKATGHKKRLTNAREAKRDYLDQPLVRSSFKSNNELYKAYLLVRNSDEFKAQYNEGNSNTIITSVPISKNIKYQSIDQFGNEHNVNRVIGVFHRNIDGTVSPVTIYPAYGQRAKLRNLTKKTPAQQQQAKTSIDSQAQQRQARQANPKTDPTSPEFDPEEFVKGRASKKHDELREVLDDRKQVLKKGSGGRSNRVTESDPHLKLTRVMNEAREREAGKKHWQKELNERFNSDGTLRDDYGTSSPTTTHKDRVDSLLSGENSVKDESIQTNKPPTKKTVDYNQPAKGLSSSVGSRGLGNNPLADMKDLKNRQKGLDNILSSKNKKNKDESGSVGAQFIGNSWKDNLKQQTRDTEARINQQGLDSARNNPPKSQEVDRPLTSEDSRGIDRQFLLGDSENQVKTSVQQQQAKSGVNDYRVSQKVNEFGKKHGIEDSLSSHSNDYIYSSKNGVEGFYKASDDTDPIILYHGTQDKSFKSLNDLDSSSNSPFFLTKDKEVAKRYSSDNHYTHPSQSEQTGNTLKGVLVVKNTEAVSIHNAEGGSQQDINMNNFLNSEYNQSINVNQNVRNIGIGETTNITITPNTHKDNFSIIGIGDYRENGTRQKLYPIQQQQAKAGLNDYRNNDNEGVSELKSYPQYLIGSNTPNISQGRNRNQSLIVEFKKDEKRTNDDTYNVKSGDKIIGQVSLKRKNDKRVHLAGLGIDDDYRHTGAAQATAHKVKKYLKDKGAKSLSIQAIPMAGSYDKNQIDSNSLVKHYLKNYYDVENIDELKDVNKTDQQKVDGVVITGSFISEGNTIFGHLKNERQKSNQDPIKSAAFLDFMKEEGISLGSNHGFTDYRDET
ncbi:MAG: Unknown protein, partial [uncultured Campylobacterales bacterium]